MCANMNGLRKSKPEDNLYGGWICPCGRFYANPDYAAHERQANRISRFECGSYELELKGWAHLAEDGHIYMGGRTVTLTQPQRDTLFDLAMCREPDSYEYGVMVSYCGEREYA